MKAFSFYTLLAVCVFSIACGCKKAKNITPITPVKNYYPLNINNEWVYAINDVYNGLDTLRVRVISKSLLSNNLPCWAVAYTDLIRLYDDTLFMYISADTILTYTNQNIKSLSGKWILANIKNNSWSGVDTSDKYYFQTPIDSVDAFGFIYRNLWNISKHPVNPVSFRTQFFQTLLLPVSNPAVVLQSC